MAHIPGRLRQKIQFNAIKDLISCEVEHSFVPPKQSWYTTGKHCISNLKPFIVKKSVSENTWLFLRWMLQYKKGSLNCFAL